MTPIEEIERRVSALERLVASLDKVVETLSLLQMENAKDEGKDRAKAMASLSILREIAGKHGVTTDAFMKHYALRCRWWHDAVLTDAENVNPAAAALLDGRTLEQVDVPDAYPSLFDALPS